MRIDSQNMPLLRSFNFFGNVFYKDAAPTALDFDATFSDRIHRFQRDGGLTQRSPSPQRFSKINNSFAALALFA